MLSRDCTQAQVRRLAHGTRHIEVHHEYILGWISPFISWTRVSVAYCPKQFLLTHHSWYHSCCKQLQKHCLHLIFPCPMNLHGKDLVSPVIVLPCKIDQSVSWHKAVQSVFQLNEFYETRLWDRQEKLEMLSSSDRARVSARIIHCTSCHDSCCTELFPPAVLTTKVQAETTENRDGIWLLLFPGFSNLVRR